MVFCPRPASRVQARLSVLALSSRFDGHQTRNPTPEQETLSVLALSSRFDGPLATLKGGPLLAFQYSLCRVVLMVLIVVNTRCSVGSLSVLALSSRFDGLQRGNMAYCIR